MEKQTNILNRYIRFCANSKINQVSKLIIDPRGEGSVLAVDTFIYPDTAIRRIRRFIKHLGLNLDYAIIPIDYPEWETCFSLWNDVKYSSKLNEPRPDTAPTCQLFVGGVEVGTVVETMMTAVLTIDLTRLDELLNEENE